MPTRAPLCGLIGLQDSSIRRESPNIRTEDSGSNRGLWKEIKAVNNVNTDAAVKALKQLADKESIEK